jgi:hypothetical protein
MPRMGVRSFDHLALPVGNAASARFDVVDGPDRRWAARGEGTADSVRDPDGVVVELRPYA